MNLFIKQFNSINKRNPLLSNEIYKVLSRYLSTSFQRRRHDYYEILQVDKHASKKQIKEAYVYLSKQSHPDSSRFDPKLRPHFSEISKAYNILSKSSSRLQYDQRSKNPLTNDMNSYDFYTIYRSNQNRANENGSKACEVILYCIFMVAVSMISVLFIINNNDDIYMKEIAILHKNQIVEKRRQGELMDMLENSHKLVKKEE